MTGTKIFPNVLLALCRTHGRVYSVYLATGTYLAKVAAESNAILYSTSSSIL